MYQPHNVLHKNISKSFLSFDNGCPHQAIMLLTYTHTEHNHTEHNHKDPQNTNCIVGIFAF